ncbi:hypothetical protein VE04_03144 [Pseudogymnoascus sp. 24MN13]|nr:hypothetical protein VE04_03144 [Pseudogymnoascus sp. 24MN13]
MPRIAGSEEPHRGLEEQGDTQPPISSTDGVRSLRRAEFHTGEMLDFLLGAELKRVEIVTRIERLLRGAEGNPELAGKRSIRLKKASSGLKRLENLVDGRLYKLEEVSEV